MRLIYPTHSNDTHDLKILMENMGRVNYGSKLQAETQQKGIRNGVILDIHFTKNGNITVLILSILIY